MRKLRIALVPVLAACLFTACGTFTVKPGADPAVVYAEYATETATATFDAFLLWERNNETALLKVNPDIHKAANEIRDNGPGWIEDLVSATRTYKRNRTDENKLKLQVAQQMLDLAIAEVRRRTAEGGSL